MVGGRVRKPSQRALEAAESEKVFKKSGIEQLEAIQEPVEQEENVDAEQAFEPADEPPAAKKRSNPTKKRSKRQGALKQFVELPLDLVCQILGYLDHRDLYNLSTLNKQFHEFMWSPAVTHVWDKAEEEARIPKLEQSMTRQQLAHLLYSGQCCFCDRKDVNKRTWALKRIICPACLKTTTCRPNELYLNIKQMHPMTQNLVEQLNFHRSRFGWSCYYSYKRPVLLEYVRWLDETLKNSHKVPKGVAKDQHGPLFSSSSCTWVGANTPQDTTEFAKKIRAERGKAERDHSKLSSWEDLMEARAREAKEATRRKRRSDIEVRLRERGWTDEDFGNDWTYHAPSFVTHTAPLSDAAFQKALPNLEEWVRPRREERRARAIVQNEAQMRDRIANEIYPFYKSTATRPIVLPINPFLLLPSVRALWERKEEIVDLNLSTIEIDEIKQQASEAASMSAEILVMRVQDAKRSIQGCGEPLADVIRGLDAIPDGDAKLTESQVDEILSNAGIPAIIRMSRLSCTQAYVSGEDHFWWQRYAMTPMCLPEAIDCHRNWFGLNDTRFFKGFTSYLGCKEGHEWALETADLIKFDFVKPLIERTMQDARSEPVRVVTERKDWYFQAWKCSCGLHWGESGYAESQVREHVRSILEQKQAKEKAPASLVNTDEDKKPSLLKDDEDKKPDNRTQEKPAVESSEHKLTFYDQVVEASQNPGNAPPGADWRPPVPQPPGPYATLIRTPTAPMEF